MEPHSKDQYNLEEKVLDEKSPRKRSSVSNYPFQFFEKNHNKKSLERTFQKHLQMAVKGTEHTVTTDTGKIFHRKFITFYYILETKKSSTEDQRNNNSEKPTLPQRDRRKVHTIERNPKRCTQRKVENRSKQKNGIGLRK